MDWGTSCPIWLVKSTVNASISGTNLSILLTSLFFTISHNSSKTRTRRSQLLPSSSGDQHSATGWAGRQTTPKSNRIPVRIIFLFIFILVYSSIYYTNIYKNPVISAPKKTKPLRFRPERTEGPPEKGRTFRENGLWHGRSLEKSQDLPGKWPPAWKVPRKKRRQLEDFLPTFSIFLTTNPGFLTTFDIASYSCRYRQELLYLYRHRSINCR